MKKGISFFFGFNDKPEDKAKMIADAGFDTAMITIEKKFEFQNGTAKQQTELLKKYNIAPSSLHMRYKDFDIKKFWQKGFCGWLLKKRLAGDIKTAKRFGFHSVVVHLAGEPSEIGLLRIKQLLNLCEKLDVNFAVENINYPKLFKYVFDNINHPKLKFCYDSGHHNIFDPQTDYLSIYGDKLVCVHLHDNSGNKDDHTLNKYGTINWDNLAQKLANIGYDGSLDYEMIMYYKRDETAFDVAQEVFKQACELEKMIKKHKKLGK